MAPASEKEKLVARLTGKGPENIVGLSCNLGCGHTVIRGGGWCAEALVGPVVIRGLWDLAIYGRGWEGLQDQIFLDDRPSASQEGSRVHQVGSFGWNRGSGDNFGSKLSEIKNLLHASAAQTWGFILLLSLENNSIILLEAGQGQFGAGSVVVKPLGKVEGRPYDGRIRLPLSDPSGPIVVTLLRDSHRRSGRLITRRRQRHNGNYDRNVLLKKKVAVTLLWWNARVAQVFKNS